MPTFKTIVGKQKEDKTFPLYIQITHLRNKKYINTGHYVVKKQLTTKGILRDEYVVSEMNEIIKNYRSKLLSVSDLNNRSLDFLKDYLKKEDVNRDIDFIKYARSFILTQSHATGKNTETALNALVDFIGMEFLDIKHLTLTMLNKLEAYLRNDRTVKRGDKEIMLRGMGDTGIKDYMGKLRQVFIAARNEYNDEDTGRMVIMHYPFRKYKMPKATVAKKRNVKVDVINKIRDTANISKRADLGRDVFMLSFYLVGINTVDLFNLTDYNNNRVSYNRAKTASRKANKAFLSIKVEPEAVPLIEKYKDETGKRVFNFYHQYANADSFSKAVNTGLKTVCNSEDNKLEPITSYYARHSWATIARNVCKVSKDDIHFALNHAAPDMKITDLYIEDDFSIIDEANRKVLDVLKV